MALQLLFRLDLELAHTLSSEPQLFGHFSGGDLIIEGPDRDGTPCVEGVPRKGRALLRLFRHDESPVFLKSS